jgi:exopolysaccharide biosynthesis predicted pyruvyltransferase EpsI
MPSSFDANYVPTASFLSEFGPNVVVYARERYSYEQAAECCSHPDNVYLEHDTAFHFNFLPHIKPRSGCGELREFCGKTQILKTVKTVRDLIHHVNRAAKVSTDRAHVAITAASLRKLTRVYPGGYHKLRGIYEFSLSHMNHVEFVEA